MNVFEYIERFKQTQGTQTYGDLMNGHKVNIVNSLNSNERGIYESIKNRDKMRLIKEEQTLINDKKVIQQPTFVSGIGEITQVC